VEAAAEPVREERANVVARLPAPGRPRVLLAGHMDTVSARGVAEPFSGALREGRLYGRGACDDKGPLAAAAAAVLRAARAGRPPAFDVTFAATVDEENTFAGAAHLAGRLAPVDRVVVLEPTGMRLVDAHKGVLRFAATTRGVACHASTPMAGQNAIYDMLPLIQNLNAVADRLASEEDGRLGRSTLVVTRIHGGSAVNIIPEACTIEADVRLLPEMDPGALAEELAALFRGRADFAPGLAAPGMRSPPGGPAWEALRTELEARGLETAPVGAAYCTDASQLRALGPCLVWGPGETAQAHVAEEWIETAALETAADILTAFLLGGETTA
jgi:acetylornithine deacetylase